MVTRYRSLGAERQGVRASADSGRHDDIDSDVARAHYKGYRTDFLHHINATILDQLSRIRIKKLDIEIHERAVVEGRHQGEIFLDKDSVAIFICHIKEIPVDNETVIGNDSVQELSGGQRVVRFHLAKEETATATLGRIVTVSPRASAQGTSDHENAYPPPASACHGLPPFASLVVWHGLINCGRATGGGSSRIYPVR